MTLLACGEGGVELCAVKMDMDTNIRSGAMCSEEGRGY